MRTVSELGPALAAIAGRVLRAAGTNRRRPGATGDGLAPSLEVQRDELAQVLYLAEQGFWGSGRDEDTPQGTAWGTSTERFLRDRYLDRADAILAAGFRKSPTFTREAVEVAQRTEGTATDPDEWIVIASALGIEVRAGG